MRAAVLVMAVVGCGRFGFDDRADGGGPDARIDAPPGVPSCEARMVTDLGTGAIGDLAVSALPDGHALGFVEAPQGNLYGLSLDPFLAPRVTMPYVTSPTQYTAATLTWSGTNLLGGLTEPTGSSYLKRLEPDMSTFTLYTEVAGGAADPAFGAAGTQWFGGVATATQAMLYPIDGTGAVSGANVTLGTAVQIEGMSLAATGPFLVSVWSSTDACFISVSDASANVVTTTMSGEACRGAQAAAGDPLHVVYTRGSQIAYRTIAVSALKVATPSAERLLGAGTQPQVIAIGGTAYIAWVDPGLHVARVTTSGLAELVLVGIPAVPPNAWQLVVIDGMPAVFAAYGAKLWALDHCK